MIFSLYNFLFTRSIQIHIYIYMTYKVRERSLMWEVKGLNGSLLIKIYGWDLIHSLVTHVTFFLLIPYLCMTFHLSIFPFHFASVCLIFYIVSPSNCLLWLKFKPLILLVLFSMLFVFSPLPRQSQVIFVCSMWRTYHCWISL